MKRYFSILFSALLLLLLSACSSNDIVSVLPEPEPVPEPEPGQKEEYSDNTARMIMDGFQPGNAFTRATLTYGANGLAAGWSSGDSFAVYATSHVKEDGSLEDNTHTSSIKFTVREGESGLSVRATTQNMGFRFDKDYRFSTCFPYQSNIDNYKAIPFSFSSQTQKGYVDMGAYYKSGSNFDNPAYKASETLACQHLGESDVLISPEMTVRDQMMDFYFRHVGTIARFFLLAPAQKMKMKKLMLISSEPIFYTGGTLSLKSHPYNPEYQPSNPESADGTDNTNYGLTLPHFSNHQLTPDESTLTDHLDLNFDDGTNNGVWNLYDTDTRYGNYFLSYLMMYPIDMTDHKYDSVNIYIYVIAEDVHGNERKFKTGALEHMKMYSSHIYQWTQRTESIDPIELTATLQSWQEVASGAIETDLEK